MIVPKEAYQRGLCQLPRRFRFAERRLGFAMAGALRVLPSLVDRGPMLLLENFLHLMGSGEGGSWKVEEANIVLHEVLMVTLRKRWEILY